MVASGPSSNYDEADFNHGLLGAFDSKAVVRVYQYVGGAALLKRVSPATSLAEMALSGRDREATEILAGVIQRMTPQGEAPKSIPTVQQWGEAFQRHVRSGNDQIPTDLVKRGQEVYFDLCSSQGPTRLLHGDLQHYNVLLDADRGWLAIDPKGVIGEVEYEVGASLRNPQERAELFASTETVKRRLRQYEAMLALNAERALAWAFSQAVLSAIWKVEGGFEVDSSDPSIMLAAVTRPMLSTSF